jgi:hypothetical protein
VQDRYAGDVGDFLNFGLLRLLFDDSDLRLGIVWYHVADETHNGDGKHISYLQTDNAIGRQLRSLDPDLHDRLGAVVRSGARSIAALERSGALPAGTVTFRERLGPNDRPGWLVRATAAMADRDVVFVDPDNGIRRSDHPIKRHRAKSEKYAYLDELRPFVDAGRSLVVYHHADRSAPVAEQARRRLADAADELGTTPLAAVRASRGSCRLFLLLPVAAHRPHFEARLERLRHSAWGTELDLYQPTAALR